MFIKYHVSTTNLIWPLKNKLKWWDYNKLISKHAAIKSHCGLQNILLQTVEAEDEEFLNGIDNFLPLHMFPFVISHVPMYFSFFQQKLWFTY